MDRRQFVTSTGALAALPLAPGIHLRGALTPILSDDRRILADVGLNAARSAGSSYADVRIGRYLTRTVQSRERNVQNVEATESYGCGVRVLVSGTWGFAATNDVTKDGIAAVAKRAAAMARANSRLQTEPVELAPQRGYGDVSWKTPIETNAFNVAIADQCALLVSAGDAALKAGASFVDCSLFFINEQKYFASTEGSYIDQEIHRLWPTFTVTVTDKATGKFETRNALSAPIGMGYEYLAGRPAGKKMGPATMLYDRSYDIIEDIRLAAEQAKEKHSAKSVVAGKYDLVLDPSHLFLTIHESVGHPLELDRVLGYEANFAGTSFATLDKWKSGTFKYGSEHVTFLADKTEPGALGTCGYDDDGVKTKQWALVDKGVLVNYEAIRDQVKMLGQSESQGCCYADSWSAVQFQRMPNVSLQPGKAPMTPAQMIGGVERGIYILGRGSYSIDQQRYNFQFGGQLFYEIKGGKIAGMLKDVAYQSNTQEFWNSVVSTGDARDYRLGGSFFDGKGQPSQVSAVSHGCATTRFNGVNVINTGRRI